MKLWNGNYTSYLCNPTTTVALDKLRLSIDGECSHIHLLIQINPRNSVADVTRRLKGGTGKCSAFDAVVVCFVASFLI